MSSDRGVIIGKKEMQRIKDAALAVWKELPSRPEVDGEAQNLESVAMIEGTIALLNSMGLLSKCPKLKYTHKR